MPIDNDGDFTLNIDPALENERIVSSTKSLEFPQSSTPSSSSRRHPSLKRKSTNLSSGVIKEPGPSHGRVTRRTAAAAASKVKADSGVRREGEVLDVFPSPQEYDTVVAQGHVGDSTEPARGEEENLMGYQWSRNSKRARKSSPKPTQVDLPPVTIPIPSASHFDPWLPSSNVCALPYGLTPFRYPCHNFHLPNPPPGDPTNPAFKPFDPLSPLSDVNHPTTLPPSSSVSSNSLPRPKSKLTVGVPEDIAGSNTFTSDCRGKPSVQNSQCSDGTSVDVKSPNLAQSRPDEHTLAFYDNAT